MEAEVSIIIAVVVAVVVVVAWLVARANRRRDGVDTFRRQIDALSSEARRPVVDQVDAARHDFPDPDTRPSVDPRPSNAGEGDDMTDGDVHGS